MRAYAGIEDRGFLADVRVSLTRHTRILMRCLQTGSNPAPEDFEFVRSNAADRAARDIPLADYLHTFRVFHMILMDAILQETRRQAGGDAALDAARGLLEYADLATTYASDAYLEAQQLLLADNDRIRRDLLEDLLAGREPGSGSRLAAANAAGLTHASPSVLIAAVPVDALEDAHALRHAASSTARAIRDAGTPLVVIRQREIVIVRALADPGTTGLARALERIQAKLAAGGIHLAIGVSTELEGVGRLPDGYREAYVAVQSIRPKGGVVCLEDLSPFEYLALCASGGAAMPLEVMRRFQERFGCIVLEGYGLSETSPIASFSRADRERKPGSIGLPIDGVEMLVVDDDGDEPPQGEVGEIAIRGHNIMKGYWRNPEATAEAIDPAGWFKTGDLGRVDEDGYFYTVDRKKEMIIRGGSNVYPREIEEVLEGVGRAQRRGDGSEIRP